MKKIEISITRETTPGFENYDYSMGIDIDGKPSFGGAVSDMQELLKKIEWYVKTYVPQPKICEKCHQVIE